MRAIAGKYFKTAVFLTAIALRVCRLVLHERLENIGLFLGELGSVCCHLNEIFELRRIGILQSQ